jgi:hypothetical protein
MYQQKFREVWDHPNPWQQEKWRTGFGAEFAKIKKKQSLAKSQARHNAFWKKMGQAEVGF